MSKRYLFLLLILLSTICDAQNLVPNGDFEQFSGCPDDQGQIDSALFWINPSVLGTPDYYNLCSVSFKATIPDNQYGYQQTHGGTGYAGIYLVQPVFSFPVREYIEVQLISPLIAGSCYHLELYVNLGNQCKWTCSAFGVYFSDVLVTGSPNYDPLPFIPQIANPPGAVFDTLNWSLVSGDYTAAGGENYIIIGNYNDDLSTDTTRINASGGQTGGYVYVDDVSLILIPSCNNAIGEQKNNPEVRVYPNPVTDKLTISVSDPAYSEFTLYDICSRPIIKERFINTLSLNTERLAAGIYIYELVNNDKVIGKGKINKD